MKVATQAKLKKPYQRPELKAVKIRPREVLGTGCHSSADLVPEACGDPQYCATP
jgi:hypothetical protein